MSLLQPQGCAEEESALWWHEELLAEEWTGREIKYLLYVITDILNTEASSTANSQSKLVHSWRPKCHERPVPFHSSVSVSHPGITFQPNLSILPFLLAQLKYPPPTSCVHLTPIPVLIPSPSSYTAMTSQIDLAISISNLALLYIL